MEKERERKTRIEIESTRKILKRGEIERERTRLILRERKRETQRESQ